MNNKKQNKEICFFFKRFSNPLKLKIMTKLNEKPASVNELVKSLRMEQSKISHALAMLKECYLVDVKKKGKHRIYHLNKKTFSFVLKAFEKHDKNCKKDSKIKKKRKR